MRLALVPLLAFAATGCVTASSQQLPTVTPLPTSALPATAIPAPQPSPARHGNEFAYVRPDRTIWLSNVDGSEQRDLVSEPLGETVYGATNAAWSPDGKYLAYETPRNTLEVLEVDTGEKTTLDDGSDGVFLEVWPPEWLSPTSVQYHKTSGDPSVSGNRAWIASIDGERIPASLAFPQCVPSTPSCDFVVARRVEEDHDGYGASLYLVRQSTDQEQFLAKGAEVLGWSWSPDGRWLAYYANARGGSTMTGEVHIREAETGRDIELGTFTTDEHAQWAPTRDRLIFYNLEIDPETGAVTELFPRPSSGVSWSPDLSKVAIVEGNIWGKGTLVSLDLASGKTTELLTIDTSLSHPAVPGLGGRWSPDGRYLSFFGWTDGMKGIEDVYLFDSETQSMTHVVTLTHAGAGSSVSYSPDWSHLLISQEFDSGEMTISVANRDGSSPVFVAEGMPLRQAWRPTDGAKP